MSTIAPAFTPLQNAITPVNGRIGAVFGYVDFNDQTTPGWSNGEYSINLLSAFASQQSFFPQAILVQNINPADVALSVETGLGQPGNLPVVGSRTLTGGYQIPIKSITTYKGPIPANSNQMTLNFKSYGYQSPYMIAPVFYAITNFPLTESERSLLNGYPASANTGFAPPVNGKNVIFKNNGSQVIVINNLRVAFGLVGASNSGLFPLIVQVRDETDNPIFDVWSINITWNGSAAINGEYIYDELNLVLLPHYSVTFGATAGTLPDGAFEMGVSYQYSTLVIL